MSKLGRVSGVELIKGAPSLFTYAQARQVFDISGKSAWIRPAFGGQEGLPTLGYLDRENHFAAAILPHSQGADGRKAR
jgi:hypothetical protein